MIALRPAPPAEAASLAALEAELALLRQLHVLLNEEAALLEQGPAITAGPDTGGVSSLAGRRGTLTQQLKAAAQARMRASAAALPGTPLPAHALAAAALPAGASQTLRRAWQGVRAAYAQIARRHHAHALLIERQAGYLHNRWNGLMHSAGLDKVYTRHGSATNTPRSGRRSVTAALALA